MKIKLLTSLVLLSIIVVIFSGVCYANSSEPPSIYIIVENAPEDMEISIDGAEGTKEIKHRGLETHFVFYSIRFAVRNIYTLDVSYSDENYSVDIDTPYEYANIYTLNYKNKEIKSGKSPWRSARYIALRVILTLLIEALVFWAFRFKGKKAWICFIIINLVTQGLLNVWLSIGSVPWSSYLIFGLVIGEVFVFAAEIIAFTLLNKDVSKLKTVLYVILANTLSLFLGGYLLTVIPI